MDLIKIELTNFRSWKSLAVNLGAYVGPTIILAEKNGDTDKSNGSGKSSVIQAIMYALYGDTGGEKLDDLINTAENSMKVVLELKLNKDTYIITRQKKRGGSQKASITKLAEDGTKSILNPSLEESLGCPSFNIVSNTIYSAQHNLPGFTALTPAGQKDVLSSLFDLDKYIILENEVRKRISTTDQDTTSALAAGEAIRQAMSTIPTLDAVALEKDVEAKTNDAKAKMELLQCAKKDASSVDAATLWLERLSNDRIAKARRLVSLKADPTRTRLNTDLQTLKARRLAIESDVAKIPALEQSLLQREEKREVLITLTKKIPELAAAERDAHKGMMEVRSAIEMESRDIAKLQQDLRKFKAAGLKCRECGAEISQGKFDSKLKELTDSISAGTGRIQEMEELSSAVVKTYNQAATALQTAEKTRAEVDSLQESINGLKDTISRYSASKEHLDVLKADIIKKEEEILEAEKVLANTISEAEKEIERIDLEMRKADQEIQKGAMLMSAVKAAELEWQSADAKRLEAEKAKAEAQALEAQRKAMQEQLNKTEARAGENRIAAQVNTELLRAFGPSGIPALIMDNLLHQLQNYLDYYLEILSGGEIRAKFVTTKINSAGKQVDTLQVLVSDGTKERNLSTFSGGEKVRIYLAIRVALAKFIASRYPDRMNYFIIDEISEMDLAGLNNLVSLLNKLSADFKQIFIVSHLEQIKEAFSNALILQRSA